MLRGWYSLMFSLIYQGKQSDTFDEIACVISVYAVHIFENWKLPFYEINAFKIKMILYSYTIINNAMVNDMLYTFMHYKQCLI